MDDHAHTTDIEVIARWLYVTSERGGRPERERAWGIPTIPEAMKEARRQQARELLASDWLAEYVDRVRADALREAADHYRSVGDSLPICAGHVTAQLDYLADDASYRFTPATCAGGEAGPC